MIIILLYFNSNQVNYMHEISMIFVFMFILFKGSRHNNYIEAKTKSVRSTWSHEVLSLAGRTKSRSGSDRRAIDFGIGGCKIWILSPSRQPSRPASRKTVRRYQVSEERDDPLQLSVHSIPPVHVDPIITRPSFLPVTDACVNGRMKRQLERGGPACRLQRILATSKGHGTCHCSTTVTENDVRRDRNHLPHGHVKPVSDAWRVGWTHSWGPFVLQYQGR